MSNTPRIWIDLENTPHVPFFMPIIRDLEHAGCNVVITARDFAQTRELIEKSRLRATFIGHEYGNTTLPKVMGILLRAIRLALHLKRVKPTLAVGHGSRGLVLAAKLMRVPSLTLYDYEGASVRLFNRLSTWVMTPEVIPFESLAALGLARSKHLTYPGLKEEIYACEFEPTTPSPIIDTERGMGQQWDFSKIVVTIRPPSHSAHYRSEESFKLFNDILSLLSNRSDVLSVLLPRTRKQRAELIEKWGTSETIIIPRAAVEGLDLLAASDLVIGGGGTVNREAAALGVPVVTIFKGPEGAVDRWLISERRMLEVKQAAEILPLVHKRERDSPSRYVSRKGLATIVNTILKLVEEHSEKLLKQSQ
ncbi:MAG: DUF354 domain-containing protein [Bacteroidota bacterium]|nr:DUF354 domain-containing protein [Bacteroidota bacterium]MDP4244025.1 DUF354 domain-containing protein [Bacteroidota bacterium]MDP4287853.1 DUF354 domain-containing protein [Bacteroidota bacterium]